MHIDIPGDNQIYQVIYQELLFQSDLHNENDFVYTIEVSNKRCSANFKN